MRDTSMALNHHATNTLQSHFTCAEKAMIQASILDIGSTERTADDVNFVTHYLFGVEGVIHGLDEHVQARLSDFVEKVDDAGYRYVAYHGSGKKTTSLGLGKSFHGKPSRMYENLKEPRVCPVLHLRGKLNQQKT